MIGSPVRSSTKGTESVYPPTSAAVSRLVQLGFLLKLGQFFGQAEAQKDPKAQELLAHSAWHLSVTLTDIKPIAVPPVVTLHGEDDVSVLSEVRLQQQYKGGRRRSSVKSVLDNASVQGVTRGPRNNRRRSSGGSSCAMSTTVSETNMVSQATDSRATASTGAAAARAPPPAAARARFSMTSSRKGTWTGLGPGPGGLVAGRTARGVATEKGPGTAAALAATATAAKGVGRRFGGGSSAVGTEEGSTQRGTDHRANLFDQTETADKKRANRGKQTDSVGCNDSSPCSNDLNNLR